MTLAPRVRRGLLLCGLAAGFIAVQPSGPRAEAGPGNEYAPGEVLVRFRRGAPKDGKDKALGKAKGRALKHLTTELDDDADEPGVWRVATGLSVPDAVAQLRNDPNVEFAEPNWKVTHSDTADDPSYANGSLWGMYGDDDPVAGPSGTTNAYGCDAEEAWSFGRTGSGNVYVGVIDEGIQFTHPDLAANVWTNPFDPANGVDDDQNGFVDDVHGWDFHHDDASVYDAADGDDHGTHVSGTIGAVGDNGAGVAGVNWSVTLISAKFLGPQGGYISDAVAALYYLRDLKARHGLNIVAASNSWGGGGYSSSMHVAILKAAKDGILFVAAAGNSNSNNDSVANYPSNYSSLVASGSESAASYESVIAVAAITSSGAKASFSSYGATTVDIGAPGVSVLSTLPTSSYGSYSGTSMATPHVSGAVALYASAFPAASAAQIRAAILGNAKATPSLAGITVTGGRLHLGGLFGEVGDPPPVVTTHDVAVTSVSMPGNVKRNKSVNVTIGVANQGTASETFQVRLTASGGIAGAPRTVTLAAGATTSVVITWTAPNAKASFSITATAATVSGETDVADNARTTTTTVR